MADGAWAFGRRVIVEDVRRDDTFMRVTWHDEAGVFVVSHWRGDVCVAATRVPVEAVPDLVNLFVRGLAESASDQPKVSRPPRGDSLMQRIRRVVQRRLGAAA